MAGGAINRSSQQPDRPTVKERQTAKKLKDRSKEQTRLTELLD